MPDVCVGALTSKISSRVSFCSSLEAKNENKPFETFLQIRTGRYIKAFEAVVIFLQLLHTKRISKVMSWQYRSDVG